MKYIFCWTWGSCTYYVQYTCVYVCLAVERGVGYYMCYLERFFAFWFLPIYGCVEDQVSFSYCHFVIDCSSTTELQRFVFYSNFVVSWRFFVISSVV